MPIARLASTGTASATTFLRGDGAWATAGSSYTLPTATDTILGGVKVGSGLSISAGVLSTTGGGTSGGTFSGSVDGGLYSALVIDGTTDPSWSSVRLLIRGNTSTSDLSGNGFAVVASGNAAASAVQKKFGAGSVAFDGAGDFLTVDTTNASPQVVSTTGDFTVEAWVWITAYNANYMSLFDTRSEADGVNGYAVTVNQSGMLNVTWGDTSAGNSIYAGGAMSTGAWHHVALCRSANTLRLFLDGEVAGSATLASGVTYSVPVLRIGRLYMTSTYLASVGMLGYWNGYMDEIRYTVAARYTTNFITPTAAFPNGTGGTGGDIVSGTFTAIPAMTSNTAPSGVVAGTAPDGSGLAWMAFDGNSSTYYKGIDATNGTPISSPYYLSYAFPEGTTSAINGYELDSEWANWPGQPKAWLFQGSNNGSTWTTLDSRSNYSNYFNNDPLHGVFALAAPANYRCYRWVFTDAAAANYVVLYRAQITA